MASSKVLNPRLPQKSCLVTGDGRWFRFFWASLGFCGVCNYSRSLQDGETSWWKMKKEAEWYIKDGGRKCPECCCGGWADLMGSHFELHTCRTKKKKVRHIFFPYIPACNIIGLLWKMSGWLWYFYDWEGVFLWSLALTCLNKECEMTSFLWRNEWRLHYLYGEGEKRSFCHKK